MTILNGVFTEPGAYSQFQPSTILPVVPGGIRTVALIGAGRATNLVKGEQVTRGVTPGGTDALAHTATVLGATITDENFVTYTLTTDYLLTGGAVVWSPSGAEPAAGVKYFVDYEYAKATADYTPQFYFNMSDITNTFGDISTANTLSLGAEIVFQQGCSAVCLAQLNVADGASLAQYQAALNRLKAINGINIVVPLSTEAAITGLSAAVKSHVDYESSLLERKERIAIMGLGGTPTISAIVSQAQGLDDKRMSLVYPPSCTRFVGANATVSTLDGSFLAAAVAGVRTSTAFDVAEPLTRKEVTGFVSIPDTLLRVEKNQLSGNGVIVIETVSAIPRVRYGTTTDISTVDSREISVVETVDYVGVSMRELLETIFIGQKILAQTPSQIRSTMTAVLTNLVQKELIVSFTNVQASVDSLDPTQINCSFSISPVFPLNWILITFSIEL